MGAYCAAMSAMLLWTQFDKYYDTAGATLDDLWRTIQRNPYAFAVGLFSFIICSSTSLLALYHCRIVSAHLTTNESVKGTFDEDDNPYDQGCVANWKAVYCNERIPSLIMATATWKEDPSPPYQ